MPLIGSMAFPCALLPVVIGWEEGVGLCGCVMNLCEAESLGDVDGLLVDARSPDNEHFLVFLAVCEGFTDRAEAFAAGQLSCAPADDDVAAVGQSAIGQRLKGFSSHQNGVSHGELLETSQIIWEPVKEAVVEADGPVFSHGGDDGDAHV